MRGQLSLDRRVFAPKHSYRGLFSPIYYLGSKARLSHRIKDAIDELDPSMGRVCDLFSGSGAVSSALSEERPVTAVDIQEYSRVLCSAILNPVKINQDEIDAILSNLKSNELQGRLDWCLEPLITYETFCIEESHKGRQEPLAGILENGPIIASIRGLSKHQKGDYSESISNALSRLKQEHLLYSPDSMTTRFFGGVYFSFSQAKDIDLCLNLAHDNILPRKNAFLASVLSTTSQIVNTVGSQFAQPIRPRDRQGVIKAGFAKKFSLTDQ